MLPNEQIISDALRKSGLDYVFESQAPNGRKIDFYIPSLDLYIEAKNHSTPRTEGQISGLTNVIVVQGVPAAQAFSILIAGKRK